MPTIIALLRKNPDISMEDFKAHYEQSHAPLILEQARPFILSYKRSYLNYEDPRCIFGLSAPGDENQDKDGFARFDVLTQLEFKDQAAMDAYFAAGKDPEITARKIADEMKFLVREERLIVVADDVRASEI